MLKSPHMNVSLLLEMEFKNVYTKSLNNTTYHMLVIYRYHLL